MENINIFKEDILLNARNIHFLTVPKQLSHSDEYILRFFKNIYFIRLGLGLIGILVKDV